MDKKQLFDFLSQLEKNNTKDWFDKNRDQWDIIRAELVVFVKAMLVQLTKFDPTLAALEPKDCIFRINKDVRFSKDKSPYKTNIGISFTMGGKKSPYAGYYLHLQPGGESFVAGGLYIVESGVLKKIRDEIDYNAKELEKIITNKTFVSHFTTMTGEKLAKPPKGYAADHPHVELLKHKSFLMWHKISDKDILNGDLLKTIPTVFKAMKPLNDYLNRAIDYKE